MSAATRRRNRMAVLAAAALTVGMLAGGAPAAQAAGNGITVAGLQTNARTTPLGIGGADPSFGWKSTSDAHGVVQSAYEVKVTKADGGADIWSSGKVTSAKQVDVVYAGPALESQTRYTWQVKVWDGDGQESAWSEPSWFETGILTASEWTGDWIGRTSEIDKWTDYTTTIDFTLGNKPAVGLNFRADGDNGYMWQISAVGGTPTLRPHKKVGGGFTLLAAKDISGTISQADLVNGHHTLAVTVDGSTITTKLDGTQIDSRTDATFAKGVIGLRQGIDESADIHQVTVTSKAGETLAETDFADGINPFMAGTIRDGALQIMNVDTVWNVQQSKPLLRKEFATTPGKTIARARVYASAQGVYQLRLNGEKVGDQHLAPGMTNYNRLMQAQTYDVTDQVNAGDNAFGAQLGDGWFAGRIAWAWDNLYGTDLSVLAQLRVDYTDGSHQVIKTDNTWKTHTGPWTATDNIDGESYDARLEPSGWEYPGYSDAGWGAAAVEPSVTSRLVPQPDEPVRTTEELPAKRHTTPSADTHVYDLGQNMVGVARMRLQGVAGQTVTIRYGEELNPDGSLYTANLRSAKATDRYTFKTTGTVVYEPTFTFHGFRYLEITGTTTAPGIADVTGVVWGSDLTPTGTLETSDSMLNQLVSNISWGQRGNFLSIPTDTPARDERLGYTGDLSVFAPTASYVSDTRAFLAKWLKDLRLTQNADGSVQSVAPGVSEEPGGSGGTGWEDAMITVPYAVWHAHGDTAIVRENYAAMKTFVGYLQTSAGADFLDPGRTQVADWLNLDDPSDAGVLAAAHFAQDARMLSEMAEAIGEDADAATYETLAADVREAFTTAYVKADGTVKGNSQTGYALALGMKLVPADHVEQVGKAYLAKLKASGNHLTTGFLGTPWLLPALTAIGKPEVAYDLLLRKDYPSWGYEIANGATTMWERWDSIREDGSFGDVAMNSFNHYAYGAVGDWMYQNIGGISAVTAGYKKSRIAPVIGGGLTSGQGTYESVYGTISSDWKTTARGLTLDISVPVNTTSEISVPAANAYAVSVDGTLLADAQDISNVTATADAVTFTVGSGSYRVTVDDQRELLGQIIDKIEALDAHTGDLANTGDLAGDDRAHLVDALDDAGTHVKAALMAQIDGDAAEVTQRLGDATQVVRGLAAWLEESSIDTPVKRDLSTRIAAIEDLLGGAVTANLGVAVALVPVVGPVLPGATARGTIEVANAGPVPLTGLKATVSVDGWKVDPTSVSLSSVAAGDSAQLPFAVSVPRHQKPGTYDASVDLTFTSGAGTFTVKDSTPWVSVDSGVKITDVSTAYPVGGSDERATVTATITNASGIDISGQLTATAPSSQLGASPSGTENLAAGASRQVVLPVFIALDSDSSPTPLTLDFVDQGVTLATKQTTLTTRHATPPATVLDHVDFGDSASEAAHAIVSSPSSGTNVEAGVTRRYSSTTPGQSFSAEVQVTPGKPFLVRNLETFDDARTKRYDIYVNDVLVDQHTQLRPIAGVGTETYQILVDEPEVLDNDGTVRIRYEYPAGASGAYDASIADSWILSVSDDEFAPDVSATVTGARGDHGWLRGDASVSVSAVDNRAGVLVVETGRSEGWQPYVAPVELSGDGKHSLSYRAKDAAGNSTGERTVPVWIDGTAPQTQLAVKRGSGVEEADRATLTFAAQDGLSGVGSTTYRVDGGDWNVVGAGDKPVVTGFGEHVVEFFTTDVAGNAEALRSAVVELADVDTISAIVVPQVKGVAAYGSTLTSTTGSWNTKGLTYSHAWLRDGKPTGRTGASYKIAAADVGRRLSVKVTASKAGASGSSTSASTVRVARAKSVTKVGYSTSKVKKGKKVRLSIRVSSSAATPRGTVKVYENGKRVKTLRLSSAGKVSYSLKLNKRGLRSIKVVYTGSSTIATSTSSTKKIRVR